jgi:hypothetical protein
MILLFSLLMFTGPVPQAFAFVDADVVEGRSVNRYRPLETGDRPVRPVSWEAPPPEGVRFGLVPIGHDPGARPAFAWDAPSSSIWIDADRDGRLSRAERHEVQAGPAAAVPVTIAGPEGAPALRRTILVRPGLLGAGPRFTVRGAMTGTLDLGGRSVRAVLTDGDADGGFGAAGADRVWLDLDADGQFDPASEQFPLGTPIAADGTSYIVASDPWAQSVVCRARDGRRGRVRLALGPGGLTLPGGGRVQRFEADLVGETGEPVTVTALDAVAEAPVDRYRITAVALRASDAAGRVWKYTFGGGRRRAVTVEPNAEARLDLLSELAFKVSLAPTADVRPGDEVAVTPHLDFAAGLYLTNCGIERNGDWRDEERTAAIVLTSPSGKTLDRASSGFL